MIARLPRWSDRRAARYLVGWWIGSIVAVSWLAAYSVLPVDVRFQWLSPHGFEIIGYLVATWLIPGLVLGGWKALLVAAGVSSIRTGTDKALIAVFTLWTLGWPAVVMLTAVRLGAFSG